MDALRYFCNGGRVANLFASVLEARGYVLEGCSREEGNGEMVEGVEDDDCGVEA